MTYLSGNFLRADLTGRPHTSAVYDVRRSHIRFGLREWSALPGRATGAVILLARDSTKSTGTGKERREAGERGDPGSTGGAWIYSGIDALGDPVIGNASGGIGPKKVGRSSNPVLPLVALIAMLAFLGFISLRHGSSESSLGNDLQSHGIRTVGTVTAAEPSNHDYFSYSYMVKGRQYSGDTNAFTSAQTVDASQLRVGQHIAVIFDAKDPQQSCSCDVNELASSAWFNDLFPLVIAIPVIAALVIALLVRRKRQKADG